MTPELVYDEIESPLGRLRLFADDAGGLHAVGWTTGHARMDKPLAVTGEARTVNATQAELRRVQNPHGLSAALAAYFAGDLRAIEGLPTVLRGTDFQRRVWSALLEIPCGETWSYGQLARHIGNPAAVRAVGLANGANPIGIVVPCHRVIGADGTLTGYGGGLERKRWLLAHERALRRSSSNLSLPFASP
jgi:methylated-DNA-[protein]-cysteine S-methyltransferase